MKKKWKWTKRIGITLASFLVIVIALGIYYNRILSISMINLGNTQLYYGNNKMGNSLIKYGLSHLDYQSADLLRATSVQNTKNGNYNASIPALEKAYQLNPNAVGDYYGWVLLYYYRDYTRALKVLNAIDKSTPNFSDFPMGECIHYLKGLAYKELKNYNEAIKEFDISIENETKTNGENWVDYQIYLNKGICLYSINKYSEAIRAFKLTLKQNEDSSEAHFYIGLSQLKLKQRPMACQSFLKAKTLIEQGYKSSNGYVELFHEIYLQDVDSALQNHCNN